MIKTIELTKTYIVHGKPFKSVKLREPTYADVYIDELGMPFEWQFTTGGTPMRIVFPKVIDNYVQRLAVEPTAESLTELSAIDAIKLEEAVCGFFTDTAAKSEGSPAS
jgi:hypothetical protein